MKCYLLLVFLLVTQPRLLAATDMAKQEGQDLIEQAIRLKTNDADLLTVSEIEAVHATQPRRLSIVYFP